jgi:ABC-type amino acid transport substrate-binding protein
MMPVRGRGTATAWLAIAAVAAIASCGPTTPRPRTEPALRVGLATDSPPMAFRRDDDVVGLEPDFARRLASDLGRNVRFVALAFEDLIPALLDGRIDVIMSGMTVTPARRFRVAFADPYLESGLVGLVRRADRARFDTVEKVLRTSAPVGVRRGTTGEKFVADRMPNATVFVYPTGEAAALELRQNRIDLFVSDAPLVAWLVSANEADLAGEWNLLTHDQLAWAFRPDDVALHDAANAALARWRADGTLETIRARWLRGWPAPR